jgi:DNA-directed RNA polymerase specialized sigma24 family protein
MSQKTGLLRNINHLSMEGFPGREPTPSTAAMVDDEWERLTAGLSKRHRAMLAKLRLGGTYEEIAAEFGLSEKTLQRLVGRLFAREESPESNSHDSDC